MPYYVLGPGGSKFGPAEMPLLAQWALEGRILPETLLEDGGGVKMPARALAGLSFPVGAASSVQTVIPQSSSQGGPLPSAPSSYMIPQDVPAPVQPPSLLNIPRGGSSYNTFLPGVNSGWASQSFLCALAAPCATFLCGMERFGLLGLVAPIYGISMASRAREGNPGLATLAIIANVVGLIAAIGMMFLRFSVWRW